MCNPFDNVKRNEDLVFDVSAEEKNVPICLADKTLFEIFVDFAARYYKLNEDVKVKD